MGSCDNEWGDNDWGDDDIDLPSNTKDRDYATFDMNKLTTEELQAEKNKMDEKFIKNKVNSTDPNFVYDVRKSFTDGVQVDDGWDDY